MARWDHVDFQVNKNTLCIPNKNSDDKITRLAKVVKDYDLLEFCFIPEALITIMLLHL